MKPIKKRAVSGNNLAIAAEDSSSSDAAPVSTTKVNNNDSISSPNNPTSINDNKSSTTPVNQQSSTQQPSSSTSTIKNSTNPKRSHKKQVKSTFKNKTQQPLFAFNAASPLSSSTSTSTNDSTSNNSTQIGISRPKRKLKQISRFNPYSSSSSHTSTNVKCGEGFSCPRCNYVCSYDSKQCEECELECYYEAGVGVVTLKERRVSVVGTAGSGKGSNSGKREGRDRKLEVKRLSDMGKGIRRKSASAAAVSSAAATAGNNGESDKKTEVSRDLILTQQSEDTTTTSNNTTTNNNTPNNNTASDLIQKKVGGRPAKSRTSNTNCNVSSLYQGAIINPLKCPHCQKDFLSEKGLQYHVDKKVCQRKHGNAGSNNNKPNTGGGASRGRPPNKVKKQPPPPRSRQQQQQQHGMGGKSLTEITGEGAGIIITPDTPRRVVTRGSGSSAKNEEEREEDTNNNNIAAAAEEEEEAAAVSAIREMASLLVMGATQVADSTIPPTPKQPADDSEEEVQSSKGGRETRSNRKKKRGLDSTASLDAALNKAMLKQDHQDIQQQADESSVTSATSASSGDSSSPFSSVSSAAVGRRRGEAAAAVDGKTSSGRRHSSLPVITETNVVSTNNNRSTRRTRTATVATGSSSKTTPPIAHDPQVAQQLAKLQSKYKSLLATAKRAKQDNAAKISHLESSLQSKEEEVILANTRISTLQDDKDDLTKKLAAIDPINYNPLFDDPDNNSKAKNDDSKLSSSLPQDNNHSASINNKMSTEEDISNCSSSEEKSVEELQHKLEEIINERDSAEEQIKELFGVQLQKDELLSQLQRTRNRLTESETKRKRDRAEFEEREKVASDDALMQRRKIIQLESLLSVVVGQRDRANSRVRDLLLGGKEDPSVPRSKEDNSNNSQVEKVLASFKSENEHLATEAKESKAEAAILQSEKDDAIKQSTQLQVSVDELRNQVDTLRSQNFNLQQDNSFERSFQSDHDECLRVLESVNITNNLEDLDESLGRSPDSLNDSLSSEDIEALPPDIMSPRSTSAAATAPQQEEQEEGLSTPQRGSPSRKQPSDSNSGNEEAGSSILNVPSLAEAQSEEAEENKLEELTNALDSLNEFEDFLLDLGLNSPQPR